MIAAGTAVALTRSDVSIASAATTFGAVRDASVTTATGHSLPASPGLRVPAGAVVTTGAGGGAQLLTRGRLVMLGPSAADQVVNGAVQQLRTGTAIVDAQQGAGLSLQVAGDTLTVPAGSATEAVRGVTVRIGALAGPAGLTGSTGRHVSLAPLFQTVLDGDAVPQTATPLHLSDSSDEARAVPELVSDDLALQTLSRGIDSTGRSAATVVEAAWSGSVAPQVSGATLGDAVLPLVIADASSAAGGSAQQRYDRVVAWRAAGGSWGVVAHLLATRASTVVSALASLQQGRPTAGGGTTQSLGGGGTRLPGQPNQTPGGPPSPGHTNTPGIPPSTQPTPTPTPTSSSGVVGGLVTTVGGVLNKVLGLLPKKSPAPTPAKPKPSSSPGLGGLLGGLTSR